MPNQFDSLYADKAFDGFTRTQGQTATLTPGGGAPVAVLGTWEPWGEEDDFDTTGKRLSRKGIYTIDPASVAPAWVPDVLDRLEIPIASGRVYEVERIAQTLPVAVLHMVEWDQRRIHGRNTFRDR